MKRATFKIYLDYSGTSRRVRGYLFGPNFGVHKDGDQWTVTHIASGRSVSFFEAFRDCSRFVKELRAVGGDSWRTVSFGHFPSRRSKWRATAIANVREAHERAGLPLPNWLNYESTGAAS
jgi:hypothetical protein